MNTTLSLPPAIVFDMDGVLIDSEIVWQQVREVYAAERGLRWTDEDQRATMGTSTPEWSRIMVDRMGLTDSPETVSVDIRERMRQAYSRHLPLRPGAVEAVRLAAAHTRTALASGSPRELIDHVLDAAGIRGCFEVVLSGDEVRHGKPDPEIYLRALTLLGVPPAGTVGIEDSHNGLRALKAAGMRAIAAPSPHFPLSAEALALADRRVDSMEVLGPDVLLHWPA